MVEIRQLFRVEENGLAGLIETDAGVGIAVGDANHHGAVHDRIEGLVERSQAVIAGLADDFVSAALAHFSRSRTGRPFFALILDFDLLEIFPVCINVLYFSAAAVDGVVFAGNRRAGVSDAPLIIRRVGALAKLEWR